MKKYKKILFGLTFVIGVLIILPFLIPVRSYLIEAEKIASEKISAPVTIGGGNFLILPSPRLVLSDIVVGKEQDLKIKSVTVIPTMNTLFSETKIVEIKVNQPIVKKSALVILSALKDKNVDSEANFKVALKHIEAKGLQLVWPNMQWPELNAHILLAEGNQLEAAVIETRNGNLKAEVTPNVDEQLVVITASNWTLPTKLPLLIDSARLEGRIKANKLSMPKIDVTLYGGKLTGNMALDWTKDLRLSGSIKVDNVSTSQPTKLMSKKLHLSGKLFANGVFSSYPKQTGAIAENLRTDFKFNVKNGVLHGLDLVKVATLLTAQGKVDGDTAFEDFSGVFNMVGKSYHLRNLKISSGLLSANGQVKVNRNKTLDGLIEVEVKRSVSLVAVPLEVSGTTSKPEIFPSKAAMAGAVAGTAILGPGVGTGLGIKAGGAVDKIRGFFGGDD